jgi:3D (Asp-Asp-Asp) domain-containing protein
MYACITAISAINFANFSNKTYIADTVASFDVACTITGTFQAVLAVGTNVFHVTLFSTISRFAHTHPAHTTASFTATAYTGLRTIVSGESGVAKADTLSALAITTTGLACARTSDRTAIIAVPARLACACEISLAGSVVNVSTVVWAINFGETLRPYPPWITAADTRSTITKSVTGTVLGTNEQRAIFTEKIFITNAYPLYWCV